MSLKVGAKFRLGKLVSKYHIIEIMLYSMNSLRKATEIIAGLNTNIRMLMIQNFKIIFSDYERMEDN
jgi:hypothetical protein